MRDAASPLESGSTAPNAVDPIVLPDAFCHLDSDLVAGGGHLDLPMIHLHLHDPVLEIRRVPLEAHDVADAERSRVDPNDGGLDV